MSKCCHTELSIYRKTLLQDSFWNLLSEQDYTTITVKDICRRADIPRRTFYHYFRNKEDVLQSAVEDLMVRCGLHTMLAPNLGSEAAKESIIRFFSFWQSGHQRILESLTKSRLEASFLQHIVYWVNAEDWRPWSNLEVNPVQMQLCILSYVSLFVTLLFYWSRNGYRETPRELAEHLIWIQHNPIFKL